MWLLDILLLQITDARSIVFPHFSSSLQNQRDTMTQTGVPLFGEKTTISYEKAYTMKPGLMSILDTQQQPQTVGQPQQLQQQISHHETLMASANLLSPMGSGAGTGTIRFHILMVEVRNEF